MRKTSGSSAALMGMLGQRLLDAGLIKESHLETALNRKKDNGGFLGEILIEMGVVTAKQIGQTLQEAIDVPYVDLGDTQVEQPAVDLVSEHYQRRNKIFPFKIEGRSIHVAMADPLNLMIIDDIHMMTGLKVIPYLSLNNELNDAYNRAFTAKSAAESVLMEIAGEEKGVIQDLSADELMDLAEDAPIIRLVNSIIQGAINSAASDIHIEPQEKEVRVRYRMDGILYEQMTIPANHHPAVISRLKIMARLNIAERRRPQDGRIAYVVDGVDFDLRVSSMPTIYGEKICMRILDKGGITVPLDRLGFFPEQKKIYESFIARPHGIILVTGPTGSGKSTTLYASLNKINAPTVNIITVEDPVEYNLPGINQMPVNHKIGITFATGLRTIVRQDPDIIMVGEIRDSETALIAVEAALTGHLVFTTIHTNDAPGAMTRLHNMGVEPFLITSAIIGAVGQRLLRKICTHCAQADKPDLDLLRAFGVSDAQIQIANFRRGKGCPKCNGRGYRGRSAAYEVMKVSDPLREAVLRTAGGAELKNICRQDGMMTMREAGLLKVLAGETTLDEVCRSLLTEEDSDIPEQMRVSAANHAIQTPKPNLAPSPQLAQVK